MKIKNIIAVLGTFALLASTSCSPEDDIRNPNLNTPAFSEDFSIGAIDNTDLNTPGWTNIAETGTAKWKEQIYNRNAYAEFSSFQSGNAVNVAWLISPEVDLSNNENQVLAFRASQSYVSSSANSLEVLIATDYDGTNLTSANWENLSATLPTSSSPLFAFIKSGFIDLSAYNGKVNIAFKVKGSGTNTSLDGSYQIDDVNIFTKN